MVDAAESTFSIDIISQLQADYREILQLLEKYGIKYPLVSKKIIVTESNGEAYSLAYPIQGLLKYHGLSDQGKRIGNFCSISLNNDTAFTLTYMKMLSTGAHDRLILNGNEISRNNTEYVRVENQLNQIRKITKSSAKTIIISRNIMRETGEIVEGKGLGTSAAAGAAIAHAFMDIVYKSQEQLRENPSLRSIFARFLAGSAARSAVGGIGLWMNYPNCPSEESFAIRIDSAQQNVNLQQIRLITVPLSSKIKTDEAHKISVTSPFYIRWALDRKYQIRQFLQALSQDRFEDWGAINEFDTLCLHSVTMTGLKANNLILWEPLTLVLVHLTQDLRNQGIPVFFSIDTGPSVVLLTLAKYVEKILFEIKHALDPFPQERKIHPFIGEIGGPSRILFEKDPEIKYLQEDISKYG
jgi:diphosphomevalonate decarboxylase